MKVKLGEGEYRPWYYVDFHGEKVVDLTPNELLQLVNANAEFERVQNIIKQKVRGESEAKQGENG